MDAVLLCIHACCPAKLTSLLLSSPSCGSLEEDVDNVEQKLPAFVLKACESHYSEPSDELQAFAAHMSLAGSMQVQLLGGIVWDAF